MDKVVLEEKIEELIHEYGNDVLRIAYMYLKDKDLAEDAFQEVFIKVYKSFDRFRMESSVKTWLIKITINVCKDMLKNNWMTKVIMFDENEIERVESNNKDIEKIIDDKELYQQILTLPEKYKDIILLYYYQGFSTSEIADILNSPVGTVVSLLKRARDYLKNIL